MTRWLASLAACALAVTTAVAREPVSPEVIEPIPPARVSNPALVELGKKLFFDPRLSRSGFISCSSCHNLGLGGTDNLRTSIGHGWQRGNANTPTIFNVSLSTAQYWDGRALTLLDQAADPIVEPTQMGSTHALALETLNTIPGYVGEFNRVFKPGRIDLRKVSAAIAAFEETLVTPDSRFDRWLKGDRKAINEQELEGYRLFKRSGCTVCHYGAALGGQSFEKMGITQPYRSRTYAQGLAAVTGDSADRFMFKVPTLRNVELTYPYFHDGGAETLEEAVEVMGRLQLGRDYSAQETESIVAFLKTLTGKLPRITLPVLPPSTPATRRPGPFD